MSADIYSEEGYYAVIPEWVLDADITAQAVRLYAVLRRYADKQTLESHPSRKKLAERLRVKDEKTVDRAVSDLEKIGAVSTFARYKDEDNNISRVRTDVFNERTSNGYIIRKYAPVGVGNPTDAPTPTPSHASTLGAQKGEEPQSLKPQSLEPQNNTRAPRREPKTRMPDGWKPSNELFMFAKDNELDPFMELELFKAWTSAQDQRYARWDAGFRQHLIKSIERKARFGGHGVKRGSTTDQRVKDAQALRAKYEDQSVTEPMLEIEP
jgi:hypothetical protein